MSQKVFHCPDGHSSDDIFFENTENYIDHPYGVCDLCTEHLNKEFGTWTSVTLYFDSFIVFFWIRGSHVNTICLALCNFPSDM